MRASSQSYDLTWIWSWIRFTHSGKLHQFGKWGCQIRVGIINVSVFISVRWKEGHHILNMHMFWITASLKEGCAYSPSLTAWDKYTGMLQTEQHLSTADDSGILEIGKICHSICSQLLAGMLGFSVYDVICSANAEPVNFLTGFLSLNFGQGWLSFMWLNWNELQASVSLIINPNWPITLDNFRHTIVVI